MTEPEKFAAEVAGNIAGLRGDSDAQALSRVWLREVARHRYAYNFTWMGRPLIQFPQDMVAIQELIWKVKPAVVVETGVAHGGSLVFSASMLELLGGEGRVIGVDIDIRPHNRQAIESHPMAKRIMLVQGSSVDPAVVRQVADAIGGRGPVLAILDSNHTHDHVLQELKLYSPLVTRGSYLVVMDTAIEEMPAGSFPDRPWDKGNNPKTAVHEFLKADPRFRIDKDMEAKLLITVAPDGYLERIAD